MKKDVQLIEICRLLSLVPLCFLFTVSLANGIDPPHNVDDPDKPVDCLGCHAVHANLGPALTKDGNANLCVSCHVLGGLAQGKPFASSMQANVGLSGTSHRWDGIMPASDDPSNPYGLRSVNSLSNSDLKRQLERFCDKNPEGACVNYRTVCSACHNQHFQTKNPWDPDAPAYGGGGTGNGRHMLRMINYYNELCEDCHYYRTPASKPGGTISQTDVRTYDGYPKSHPIGKVFSNASGETRNVANANQFHNAPLKPGAASWAQQTGARYKNGNPDPNSTNNMILDAGFRIRCLSCHGIHYTDSDSSTIDGP